MSSARYVAETAIIRTVEEYESAGSRMAIREGFRVGWSHSAWRPFLINLLVAPLAHSGYDIVYYDWGVVLLVTLSHSGEALAMFLIVAPAITVFPVILIVGILSILLQFLPNFF